MPIELYKEVADAAPKSVKPLNDLAYLLAERAGRPDEALPYAERAAELEPDDPSVQDTLGWIYYRKGLYSKAADYLKTASAKADGSAVIRYHLSMAYSRSGKQALSQQTLAAALTMDPNLPEAEAARQVLQERHPTAN